MPKAKVKSATKSRPAQPAKPAEPAILTVSEKKLAENPLAIPFQFLSGEAQAVLLKHMDKLHYFDPYAGYWTVRDNALGALSGGFVYRIDPEAVCVPDPEKICEEEVGHEGGYWRVGVRGVLLSDATASMRFRGFRYPDGKVRQVLDRTYGVPTHCLVAEEEEDD